MAEAHPVIVTCAVTGAIHTPGMSPHLPATAEAIVASALEAAAAGATVLHLHARGEAGRPDQSVEGLRAVVEPIRAATDALVNVTTGGSPYMSVEERARPAAALAPDLA
ncbi:MAG: 3-keto-5-aminohexanoate cleavage protein, partial [Jannaschia sp.]